MTTPKYHLSGKHWVSPGQTCVDSEFIGQHPANHINTEQQLLMHAQLLGYYRSSNNACRPEKLRHLITPTATRTSYISIYSEMQRERHKME